MSEENKKVGYLEEEAGVKSSNRLIGFLAAGIPLLLIVYMNVMNSIKSDSVVIQLASISSGYYIIIGMGITAVLGKAFIENMSQLSEIVGKIAEAIVKIKGAK